MANGAFLNLRTIVRLMMNDGPAQWSSGVLSRSRQRRFLNVATQSCDSYANEFNIIFNAWKSKFLVCIPSKLRSMFNNLNLNGCLFYIGG